MVDTSDVGLIPGDVYCVGLGVFSFIWMLSTLLNSTALWSVVVVSWTRITLVTFFFSYRSRHVRKWLMVLSLLLLSRISWKCWHDHLFCLCIAYMSLCCPSISQVTLTTLILLISLNPISSVSPISHPHTLWTQYLVPVRCFFYSLALQREEKDWFWLLSHGSTIFGFSTFSFISLGSRDQ